MAAVLTPVDAEARVEVSEDKMRAYLFLTAPQLEGKELTKDMITNALNANGVKFGLDDDLIAQMFNEKMYNRKLCIAKGSSCDNGVDGAIEYLFEPTSELKPMKNERGEVDFRNLGLVRNILEGTVIAKITPPTNGTNGMSVQGVTTAAKPGNKAKYQVGKGVMLTEDEAELKAIYDGNLSWDRDHFNVEDTLVVKTDVNLTTGNIDFIGDVTVKGNVSEGFVVKSKKNISVNGGCFGATLEAGENIVINVGCVNSNITVKGEFRANFCEGATIKATGNVISQSFVFCNIVCSSQILSTAGKGILLGGKLTAVNGFEVNIVGNDNNVPTRLTAGNAGVLSEEIAAEENHINEIQGQLFKLNQISELLQEHKKKYGKLSPDREAMLSSSIRSRFTLEREKKECQKKIVELNAQLNQEFSASIIVRKDIYPGVQVHAGTATIIIERHLSRCELKPDADGFLAFLPI